MGVPTTPPRWELAAEAIAVKIRWLGLILGYVYVNTGQFEERARLNAILALGLAFTLLDTLASLRGRVFLGRHPLAVSSMEALFIGLLCADTGGLGSRFHYYYFLSLICCALRHPLGVTYLTCGMHCLSVTALYAAQPAATRAPFELVLMVLILNWVTWAAGSLGLLLRRVGDYLAEANTALTDHQARLEERIADRTRELQEAQAQVLHQEKMAAFGLLAAGIAHEVGNPLTAVSSIVQLLERKDLDPAVREKLALAGGQVRRIREILRELNNFSRPSSPQRTRLDPAAVIDEALAIARYAGGAKSRTVTTDVPGDLPAIVGVRGQLVQVVLNLVLNAIEATAKGGTVAISAWEDAGTVMVEVADDGPGIDAAHRARLFQPYFTTKRHGTGLGLFVTRKLLADHGGAIEVFDRTGGGTAFRARLPAARPSPISPEPVHVAVRAGS